MTVTRFAPSPTGRLHLGNVRTALINRLLARGHGGRFLLRIDDTDAERSRAEFAEAIRADLRWLGLSWDGEHVQSERFPVYDAAFERLRGAGRVYAAYETDDELAAKRAAARKAGRPPLYDRAGRRLNDALRRALEAEGRRPHWRFALPDGAIEWRDAVQGPKRVEGANLSDPVIRRDDGTPTFLFAGAVDDLDLGITDVVRGEDHVTNTAVQIAMIDALGGRAPRFAHLPLMVDPAGKGLSKRLGSLGVDDFRAGGVEPEAILAVLAALGTARAPSPAIRPDDLADGFDLAAFGRAPPKFDPADIARTNAVFVRGLAFADARPRLRALGLEDVDPAFWDAVRPNLERLADARDWRRVVDGPLTPAAPAEDEGFLDACAEALPDSLEGDGFDAWVAAIRQTTGRKGKALFRPIRLALTAREHGPELRHLLTLMPLERVRARLRGTRA